MREEIKSSSGSDYWPVVSTVEQLINEGKKWVLVGVDLRGASISRWEWVNEPINGACPLFHFLLTFPVHHKQHSTAFLQSILGLIRWWLAALSQCNIYWTAIGNLNYDYAFSKEKRGQGRQSLPLCLAHIPNYAHLRYYEWINCLIDSFSGRADTAPYHYHRGGQSESEPTKTLCWSAGANKRVLSLAASPKAIIILSI